MKAKKFFELVFMIGMFIASFNPVSANAEGDYIFFPYVVQGMQESAWSSTIAVSFRESGDAAYCKLTLKDRAGNVAVWEKTGMDNPVVWSFVLDDIISNFSGSLVSGAGSLKVASNYRIDGFSSLNAGGTFGAGYGARYYRAKVKEGAGSIFFPYVLQGVQSTTGFATGIAISSLEDEIPADAYCELTLRDSAGNTATYRRTFWGEGLVWAFVLDDEMDNFSGTIASGACSLEVESNYAIDGFSFINVAGAFGYGSLAAMPESVTGDINGDNQIGLEEAIHALKAAAKVSQQSDKDWIVFEKWLPYLDGWGQPELWIVRSDGSDLRPISQGGWDMGASWSPNGEYIAFVRSNDGFFIVRPDGSDLRHIISDRRLHYPQWVTNDLIIFSSSGDLYAISTETLDEQMINVGVSGAFGPVISPDRQYIAFHAADGDSESSAYISTINGENVRRLETAEGPVRGYPMSWYAGGLYVTTKGAGCMKIDVENSETEIVEGVDECNISWSPDGDRASYQFENEIWLMDSNGENKRVLVAPDDGSHLRYPVWSP